MRKYRALTALLLACLLMLGCAAAEEPQVYTISLLEGEAGYDGVWNELGPFALYLPENTETIKQPAFDEEGSFSATYSIGSGVLAITSTSDAYAYTVEECTELLKQLEKIDVNIVECDGRTFVGGDDPETGGSMILWLDEHGKMFIFYCSYGTDMTLAETMLRLVLSLAPAASN